MAKNYVKPIALAIQELNKNAISPPTTNAQGTIVANMGNGNYITYRPLSASSSGFDASINFNFRQIWANDRVLKFK
ncbi:hypothetical protein [uncultured Lutibacter sp.]|uniref:hypothetical protein n=1 Tax=uncultured Lutibacter sp. TaxID=437739 RepID=UPI00260B68DF|nr:hypothetical protein [uncultured Lutibacter sp.]